MKVVPIPLINEKKKLFKRANPFIKEGYMRKIYSDEILAVFSFGEVLYLACPYAYDKNPFGLLVTAEEAEYIITENTSYLINLLEGDTDEARFISLDKETFINYPSIIQDLKTRFPDEHTDRKTEQRIKEHIITETNKCKSAIAKSTTNFYMHKKRLLIYLAVAFFFIALQFIAIRYEDFRHQFDDPIQAETFDKFSTEEDVYASLECNFLTLLESHYSQTQSGKVDSTDYFLFGNTETKQFGIVSVDTIHIGEFEKIQEQIDKNGFYKGEMVTLYGHTRLDPPSISMSGIDTSYTSPHGFTAYALNSAYSSNDDYSADALKHFSEQMFEIDNSTDFGQTYLDEASTEPIRDISFINMFFDCFISVILGMIIMFIGAFRHGLKLEKISNAIKPIKGRIKCLKENNLNI